MKHNTLMKTLVIRTLCFAPFLLKNSTDTETHENYTNMNETVREVTIVFSHRFLDSPVIKIYPYKLWPIQQFMDLDKVMKFCSFFFFLISTCPPHLICIHLHLPSCAQSIWHPF